MTLKQAQSIVKLYGFFLRVRPWGFELYGSDQHSDAVYETLAEAVWFARTA